MFISPMNICHQSIQPIEVQSMTSTQLTPESLNEAVVQAFLSRDFEWIENGVINGTVDPNMMVNLSFEEMLDISVYAYTVSPEESKKDVAEVIQNILHELGNYEFDGNTSGVMWYLKNAEYHVEVFDILDSDLCAFLKEEALKQLIKSKLEDQDVVMSVDVPIFHLAQGSKCTRLIELLDNYGANPTPWIKVECDSSKITRETLENALPEGSIIA